MLQILRDYLELGRREHLRIDFGLSFFFGLIIIIVLIAFNICLLDIIEKFNSLIGTIITAFSILAGFNTTSLTIFATSSSPVVIYLKEHLIEGTNRAKIEQVFAYFSWSVVVQLTLLFLSIIVSFLFAYMPVYIFQNKIGTLLVWFIVFMGIIGIQYSILITIRNVSILYQYLIADTRKTSN